MGDLSKEQEQAIARSTMYLVAALLTILMMLIAGLFLSAELEQQALQKAETAQQLARQAAPARVQLPRAGDAGQHRLLVLPPMAPRTHVRSRPRRGGTRHRGAPRQDRPHAEWHAHCRRGRRGQERPNFSAGAERDQFAGGRGQRAQAGCSAAAYCAWPARSHIERITCHVPSPMMSE